MKTLEEIHEEYRRQEEVGESYKRNYHLAISRLSKRTMALFLGIGLVSPLIGSLPPWWFVLLSGLISALLGLAVVQLRCGPSTAALLYGGGMLGFDLIGLILVGYPFNPVFGMWMFVFYPVCGAVLGIHLSQRFP